VWKRVESRSEVGFTAAPALSNFPDPARIGKTAHNSHRFLMETLLRQCSLEPQGFIFPDRRTSEIRKCKTRYMPTSDRDSTLFHTPSLLAEIYFVILFTNDKIRAFFVVSSSFE